MGNFEKNLKEHVNFLDDKIGSLMYERSNLDWGHDCDCEYCFRDELPPDDTEKRAAEIDKEVKEINQLKKTLMRHCELTNPPKKRNKK